jgi:hypothetical protein
MPWSDARRGRQDSGALALVGHHLPAQHPMNDRIDMQPDAASDIALARMIADREDKARLRAITPEQISADKALCERSFAGISAFEWNRAARDVREFMVAARERLPAYIAEVERLAVELVTTETNRVASAEAARDTCVCKFDGQTDMPYRQCDYHKTQAEKIARLAARVAELERDRSRTPSFKERPE